MARHPLAWSSQAVITKLCPCGCNRTIIFLRRGDWRDDHRRYVRCYARNWDGNPWFTKGVHMEHPHGRYKAGVIELKGIPNPDFIYPGR
jgi:hypothetical protein